MAFKNLFQQSSLALVLTSILNLHAMQPNVLALAQYQRPAMDAQRAQYVLQTASPYIRGLAALLINPQNAVPSAILIDGPAGSGKKTDLEAVAERTGREYFVLPGSQLFDTHGAQVLPALGALVQQIRQRPNRSIVAIDCFDLLALSHQTPHGNLALNFLHALYQSQNAPHVLWVPLAKSPTIRDFIINQVRMPNFSLHDGNELLKKQLIVQYYLTQSPNNCTPEEVTKVISRLETDNPSYINNCFRLAQVQARSRNIVNPTLSYADLDQALPAEVTCWDCCLSGLRWAWRNQGSIIFIVGLLGSRCSTGGRANQGNHNNTNLPTQSPVPYTMSSELKNQLDSLTRNRDVLSDLMHKTPAGSTIGLDSYSYIEKFLHKGN